MCDLPYPGDGLEQNKYAQRLMPFKSVVMYGWGSQLFKVLKKIYVL